MVNYKYTTLILLVLFTFLAPTAGAAPEQVHVSTQGDPSTTATVIWKTGLFDTQTHQVKYGTFSGFYTQVDDGFSQASPHQMLGYLHEVQLTGLQPNTRYFYVCGDDTDGWSPEFSFKTAPAGYMDFDFLMYSDIGVLNFATHTVNMISQMNPIPPLQICAGDLACHDGMQILFDQWFNLIQPMAANCIWMPTLGNHEEDEAQGGGYGAYYGRFALPGNESYYSFNWSNIHFIVLDTHDTGYGSGTAQNQWLESDLQAASQDPQHPWIIVAFHKPPYSTGDKHPSSTSVQAAFCDLFDQYGVDICLTGHNHAYERTYPLNNGQIVSTASDRYHDPTGTIYLVSGGAGRFLYFQWQNQEAWSHKRASAYHICKFTMRNFDTLKCEVLEVPTGNKLDEFTIVKTGLSTPTPPPTNTPTPQPTNTSTPIPPTPTQTPVPPTETPTPDVTDTPLPTETPMPTDTPTPRDTSTPAPTATPTPVNTRTAPPVLLAGFWDTDITHLHGGQLQVIALVTDNLNTKVIALGSVELFDDGRHGDFSAGDGIFGLNANIGSSTDSGAYLIDIVTERNTVTGPAWPWLVVE